MAANPIAKSFDTVLFAAEPTPGVAVVEGSDGSPRKWQVVGGFGLTGATIRFTGLGLAKFDVILSFYTPEHWTAWESYQRGVLAPPKPGQPGALNVYHPLLRAADIGQCVVENISLPKQTQDGVWQVVISCMQYRKPVAMQFLTPESAKATPTDPVDNLIGQRFEKIRARSLESDNFGRLTRGQAEAMAANEALAQRIARGER